MEYEEVLGVGGQQGGVLHQPQGYTQQSHPLLSDQPIPPIMPLAKHSVVHQVQTHFDLGTELHHHIPIDDV